MGWRYLHCSNLLHFPLSLYSKQTLIGCLKLHLFARNNEQEPWELNEGHNLVPILLYPSMLPTVPFVFKNKDSGLHLQLF